MIDDQAFEERIIKMEAALEQILATTIKLESRIDILRQEFQRTSTNIYRLGVNQESGKTVAGRHQSVLSEIQSQLLRIETRLKGL